MFPGAVGSVRLTGGLIPQQGHVEVCLNGSWSRVCHSSWSQRDAAVACRQLNFPVSELSKKIHYPLQLHLTIDDCHSTLNLGRKMA